MNRGWKWCVSPPDWSVITCLLSPPRPSPLLLGRMRLIPRAPLDLFVEGGQVHQREVSVSSRRALRGGPIHPKHTQWTLTSALGNDTGRNMSVLNHWDLFCSVTKAVSISLSRSMKCFCWLTEELTFWKEKKHYCRMWLRYWNKPSAPCYRLMCKLKKKIQL